MPQEGTTFNEFLSNVQRCKLQDLVVPVKMTSLEAEKKWSGDPIGLLLIDGDHSVEGCEGDFLAWTKYLVPGGILLLHDVGDDFPGPAHVVKHYPTNSNAYQCLFQIDSLQVAIKVA